MVMVVDYLGVRRLRRLYCRLGRQPRLVEMIGSQSSAGASMDLFLLPIVVVGCILEAGKGRFSPRLKIKVGLFIIATV